jgi:hypothetical protein
VSGRDRSKVQVEALLLSCAAEDSVDLPEQANCRLVGGLVGLGQRALELLLVEDQSLFRVTPLAPLREGEPQPPRAASQKRLLPCRLRVSLKQEDLDE